MMIESSGDPSAFFKAHPNLETRYANDAAFHKGFDAMVWSRDHGHLVETTAALNKRDARYDAAHIACRA